MSLQQDNVISLIDEDGKEIKFEHIDTVLYDGVEYVLLLPLEPLDGVGEDEEGVVILRIVPGEAEGDEDTYENVEDDDLLDTVFEQYLASMDDEDLDE